jgi:putative tryptophan/tyrosine transport system substrate-binding protein
MRELKSRLPLFLVAAKQIGKEKRMKTQRIAIWVAVLIMGSIQFVSAQEPKKMPKIGYLSGGSASAAAPRVDAFRQGLRQLGYTEGRNIEVEFRYADGNLDRMPDLAAELVRLKVDVIVSGTEQGTRAVQQATKSMPIVLTASGDPVASGFVASPARPGGNITGTTSATSSETTRKRVELLKEAVPKLSYLVVVWNPGNLGQRQLLKETDEAAKALDLKFRSVELERPADLENAFAAITKERPDGLIILRSPIVAVSAKRITEFAEKNRLPAMYGDSQLVEVGGLMSYAPDLLDLDRRGAVYVDKILKGAKPADLPVEGPKKFEVVINLKTAQQIGLDIPPAVLKRADKVIK